MWAGSPCQQENAGAPKINPPPVSGNWLRTAHLSHLPKSLLSSINILHCKEEPSRNKFLSECLKPSWPFASVLPLPVPTLPQLNQLLTLSQGWSSLLCLNQPKLEAGSKHAQVLPAVRGKYVLWKKNYAWISKKKLLHLNKPLFWVPFSCELPPCNRTPKGDKPEVPSVSWFIGLDFCFGPLSKFQLATTKLLPISSSLLCTHTCTLLCLRKGM